MPHIVIEYSDNLEPSVDIEKLMEAVCGAAIRSDIMNPKDLKIRAIPYSHFRLVDLGETFVHVTCRLLAGRKPPQKTHLAKLLRQSLTDLTPHIHSISVEIVDMDPDSYRKRLSGT